MKEDALKIISEVFQSQNIQSFSCQKPFSEIERIDYNFRKILFGGLENYQPIISWLTKYIKIDSLYLLEDFYHFATVVFKIDDEKFFIIGPFSFDTKAEHAKYIEESLSGFSNEIKEAVGKFCSQLPFLPSRDSFVNFICAFIPPLLERKMTFTYRAFLSEKDFWLGLDKKALSYLDLSPEKAILEDRYRLENQMLLAVKKGNTEEAKKLHSRMAEQPIKPRNPNSLRNLKNFSIILNTLLRKAVEEDEIHPLFLDSISAKFAIQIEEAASLIQIEKLGPAMIEEYCAMVQKHSRKNYSLSVKKCIDYIDFNFKSFISLKTIAEDLSLNPSYLSSIFSKETGIPLTQYIKKARVEYAKKELSESTKSIDDIANECGYEDMNYFSRVFKSIEGKSPSEFRKASKNDSDFTLKK